MFYCCCENRGRSPPLLLCVVLYLTSYNFMALFCIGGAIIFFPCTSTRTEQSRPPINKTTATTTIAANARTHTRIKYLLFLNDALHRTKRSRARAHDESIHTFLHQQNNTQQPITIAFCFSGDFIYRQTFRLFVSAGQNAMVRCWRRRRWWWWWPLLFFKSVVEKRVFL